MLYPLFLLCLASQIYVASTLQLSGWRSLRRGGKLHARDRIREKIRKDLAIGTSQSLSSETQMCFTGFPLSIGFGKRYQANGTSDSKLYGPNLPLPQDPSPRLMLRGVAAKLAAQSAPAFAQQRAIHVFKTIAEVRAWRKEQFAAKKSVGFVPTMGALHEGHIQLTRHARECDKVVSNRGSRVGGNDLKRVTTLVCAILAPSSLPCSLPLNHPSLPDREHLRQSYAVPARRRLQRIPAHARRRRR